MGWCGVREGLQLLFFVFSFLVFLISRGLIATTLAILALTAALTGSLLQLVTPSDVFLIIAYIGSISAFLVAGYALGFRGDRPAVEKTRPTQHEQMETGIYAVSQTILSPR